MTALAGVWRFEGSARGDDEVGRMLHAQRGFGSDTVHSASIAGVAMGRSLYPSLLEDRWDRQPMEDASSRILMVADARLDNREELLERLALPQREPVSDSFLLFLAYRQWREQCLELASGDFAFAVFHQDEQRLLLARDPLGQRPLHYLSQPGRGAFSSMAKGLHALSWIERRLDREQMARYVAGLAKPPSQTFFEGIARVDPGHVVRISPAGVSTRRYWHPDGAELRLNSDEDYAEAFRAELDRATRVRLRRARGKVGVHLSAGLDSGAVAATAARQQTDEALLAFTAAPRLGFAGPTPANRIADESLLAGQVAASFPNVEHVVLRSVGSSLPRLIATALDVYEQPIGYPCNHSWWAAINAAAAGRDVTVMLTGEAGNLTISAGGLSVLATLLGRSHWRRWAHEARAIHREGMSWRGIAATSIGPWLPPPLWTLVSRLRPAGGAGDGPLLDPRAGARVAAQVAEQDWLGQPPRDEKDVRRKLLFEVDPGNTRKGALAEWGIETRDPTADRRLVEFCFSLPPAQLLKEGVTRSLARRALADRLPGDVIHARRGYQFADWYEVFDRRAVADLLRSVEASGGGDGLLDLPRMRRMVESWPGPDPASLETIGAYRIQLLRALSAGVFAGILRK